VSAPAAAAGGVIKADQRALALLFS
jgi:hypothetical protein